MECKKLNEYQNSLPQESDSSIKSSYQPEDFAGIAGALVYANAKKITSHPAYCNRTLKRPIKKRVALFLILLPTFTM